MFHPPALQYIFIWSGRPSLNLEFSDSSGAEEIGPWLSPAPSSTARGHVDMYLDITAHTSKFQSWPQAWGPTHCSVVCPWKEGSREEAHTAPESSLGPLRQMILGSRVPGLGEGRHSLGCGEPRLQVNTSLDPTEPRPCGERLKETQRRVL